MEHFEILKVGAEPNKRFLQKRMTGSHWTNKFHAHKFFTLKEASDEASSHENVKIIWVNGSSWGEVEHTLYNYPVCTNNQRFSR